MTKRSNKFSSKKKQTAEERAAIDADREAAYKGQSEGEGDLAVIDKPVEAPVEPETSVETDVPEPVVEQAEPVAELVTEPAPDADAQEASDEAAVEEDNAKPNSVVAPKFKDKYLANARAQGLKGKAAKRSNWDWLAQNIATVCLGEKDKISIPKFKELLTVNGVDYSKWTNTNKGWEGRFRMTGRVALQKVVANAAVLKVPGSDEALVPPADFIAKFKTKE